MTNKYLKQVDSRLQVTSDYMDPNTHFFFKPFAKNANNSYLAAEDMAFVRGSTGDYLILKEGASIDFKADTERNTESARDDDQGPVITHRMMASRMSMQELLPDSDALMIVPVRSAAMKAVVSVRCVVLVLQDYQKELVKLPDCQSNQIMKAGRTDGRPGATGEQGVLEITNGLYDKVERSLRKLVINCTWSDDTDPMSRDGARNP